MRRRVTLGWLSFLVASSMLGGCGETAPPAVPIDAARRDAVIDLDASAPSFDAPMVGLDAPDPAVDAALADDAAASACGPCAAGMVCCSEPLPCAGSCVPDCRTGPGCMGAGLVCNPASGVCEPPSPDAGVATDAARATDATVSRDDVGASTDAATLVRDAGAARDSGRDAGGSTSCTGAAPATGAGIAEARIGSSTWSSQFSGNFTALSGDTAVVGHEGVWGTSAGQARVFRWDACTATWELEATLVGARTTEEDVFGSAVAIEGDTLVVGANMRPDSSNTGAVHVFSRSGTTWTERPPIYPPTAAGGRFGRALALAGSVLVVGAPYGKDPSSAVTYTGIVSLYTRGAGGMWSYVEPLGGAAMARNDAFGYALSLDADTLVVGAPGAFNWAVGAGTPGKAWVFTGGGASWSEQQLLTPSDGANDDWFGRSVAHVGDTVVIGAPRHDVASAGGTISNAGAVYVFSRAGSTWTETARLTASDASADAFFGFTVGLVSETRLVVGAAGAGRLYTFTRSGATWSQGPVTHAACSGAIGWTLDVEGELAITARPSGVFDLADPDASCLP